MSNNYPDYIGGTCNDQTGYNPSCDHFKPVCGPDDCGCNPPAPPCPPHNCNQNPCPVPPPVRPIPPFIPGTNAGQQMSIVVDRANEAIHRFNSIQAKCYEALNKMVGAAISNDVYYDCDEVNFQRGYNIDDSCAYSVVRVNKYDKKGCPIVIKLGLAYDNTTNSNLKQSIQDFSFVKSANVIMTAIPPKQTGWNGPARYQNGPIPGNNVPDSYVAGFNCNGTLKVFKGDADDVVLCQNKITESIGACIPIIMDGAITEEAKKLTTKSAVCALGYISGNCQRVMFTCGAQEETGMQGINVAKVLLDMGCTTAVITAMQTNEPNVDSIGMSYMGRYCEQPIKYVTPNNQAFWYVTKRPFDCCRNGFETEIADLVQKTGMNANGIAELKNGVNEALDMAGQALELAQSHEDRIVTLENEVQELDGRMDTAEANIKTLQDETKRIEAKLDQEISDRELQDTLIRQSIETEKAERTAADAVLQGNINREAIDRANADLKIEQNLAKEVANRTEADQLLQNQINGLVGGTTAMPYVRKAGDNMSGNLTMGGQATVILGRGPTANMEAATKQYVDDAVNSGTGTGTDVSKEYVDKQISNLNGQLGNKVNKSGDTMTGELVLSGTPANVQAAVPKDYVDKENQKQDTKIDKNASDIGTLQGDVNDVEQSVTEIQQELEGIKGGTTALPYVKKSGDTMTGDLSVSTVKNPNNPNTNIQISDGTVSATGTRTKASLTSSGMKLYNDDSSKTTISFDPQNGITREKISGNHNSSELKLQADSIKGTKLDGTEYSPVDDADLTTKKYVDSLSGNPFPDVPFTDDKWKFGGEKTITSYNQSENLIASGVTRVPTEFLIVVTGKNTTSYQARVTVFGRIPFIIASTEHSAAIRILADSSSSTGCSFTWADNQLYTLGFNINDKEIEVSKSGNFNAKVTVYWR